MKHRRLSALAISMVLLVTCLISVPVFPGENPWDADLSGGKGDGVGIVIPGDDDRDSLIIIIEDTVVVTNDSTSYSASSSPTPSWWESMMTQAALWFASTW